MKKFLLSAFLFCGAFNSFSQGQLVKDINSTPGQIQSPNDFTGLFTKSGSLVYFPITNFSGTELWRTDGTQAGTNMILDLNPGLSNGFNQSIAPFKGRTFFGGDNGITGFELWVTNGSASGTELIKDINATGGSDPLNFFEFKNLLYFSANDGVSGRSLWRTDGTNAGTELFLNAPTGLNSESTVTPVGTNATALYFVVTETDQINQNFQLWKTDGTKGVSIKLAEFLHYPDGTTIMPYNFILSGNNLYFGVSDYSTFEDKLWKSDGTVAGTVPIESSYVSAIFPFNNKIIFTGLYNSYITDGTPNSAQLLGGQITAGVKVANDFYGLGFNPFTNGTDLTKTDGTAAGTKVVAELGSANSSMELPILNNSIFLPYNPSNISNGEELGIFDLGSQTIALLKEINPGVDGSRPKNFIEINNRLLFLADDGVHGTEIWQTDGTAVGTSLLMDIKLATADANIGRITTLHSDLFFRATSSPFGSSTEFWKSGGDAASTAQFENLNAASVIGKTENDFYLFTRTKMYKSNGQIGGSVLLKDFAGLASSFSLPNETSTVSNGKFFFWLGIYQGTLVTGMEPWVTDGTPAGTNLLKDIAPGINGSIPFKGADLNSKYLFSADDNSVGQELWISDGTESGTMLLKDINPGATSSTPQNITQVGAKLLFTATTDSDGSELWKTDGTSNGTTLVKNIKSGSGSSSPSNFITFANQMFFIASDDNHAMSLWKTDGTETGTTMVKFIANGIQNLMSTGSQLFMSADDGVHGRELWVSDGTENGTVLIDIKPGSSSSNPTILLSVGNVCVFSSGGKLWKSGGTIETTMSVSDLTPTNAPQAIDNWIYFGANSEYYGNELFKLKVKQVQTITLNNLAAKKFGDDDFATGGSTTSTLPLTYQFSVPGIVEFVNGKFKILKAGVVDITATQIGNDDFDAAAPVIKTLTINKADQTIAFNALSSKILGEPGFTLSASATSALAVSYSSSSDKVNISGSQVQLLKAGKAKINAAQSGNVNYNAATAVEQEFCINPAKPTISISGGELTSSNETGNVWYKDDVALTSITKTITASSGTYKVKTVVDGCESVFSDARVIIITGIAEDQEFKLYPVPSSGAINISLPQYSGQAGISIQGMQGNNVIEMKTSGRQESIDISALASGVYLLKVGYGDKVHIAKIVKQ